MSARVILNLLKKSRKRDKRQTPMRRDTRQGLLNILSLFYNEFYKFKNYKSKNVGFFYSLYS